MNPVVHPTIKEIFNMYAYFDHIQFYWGIKRVVDIIELVYDGLYLV